MFENTVGIPEGTEIHEEAPKCTCEWRTFACYPPIHKLVRKCNYCKELEGIPIEPEPDTEPVALSDANVPVGGQSGQVMAITDKSIGYVDPD